MDIDHYVIAGDRAPSVERRIFRSSPDIAPAPAPDTAEGGSRTGPSGRPRLLAVADRVLTAALIVLVLTVTSVVAGEMLGYNFLTIKSGSMTPTISVGDVVVDTSVSPIDVHRGDIVTFRDPDLSQQLVTHRVVRVHRAGARFYFLTKGDANRTAEDWNVVATGHIGREVAVVPFVGRILAYVSPPPVRTAGLVVALLCLAFMGLRWIWRDPDPLAGGARGGDGQRGGVLAGVRSAVTQRKNRPVTTTTA